MSDGVPSSANTANSATNTNNSGDSNVNTENNLNTNVNTDNQNNNDSQNNNADNNAKDDALGDLFSEQQKDNGQQNNVPESYQFVDADGNDYGFDAETQKGFTDAFKDLGLSQEQATKALNLYVNDIKEFVAQTQAENEQQQKAQIKQWKNEVANDPSLGGQNLQQTKQNIANVMNKFSAEIPELRDFLNSGAGYNPAMVKLLNAVGSQLGNDSNFINGKGGGAHEESSYEQAKRLYPNSPSLWR